MLHRSNLKKVVSILSFFSILVLLFQVYPIANATNITVRINNISGPTSSLGFVLPTGSNIKTTTGYIDANSKAYVNVNNFNSLKGVTVQTSYYYGYYAHTLKRANETITVYDTSNYLYVSQPDFNFSYQGSLDDIVRYDYVPVKVTSKAIGCDYVQWDSSTNTVTVWDRLSYITSTMPSLLIAGPWINNWSSLDPTLASSSFTLKDFICMDDPYQDPQTGTWYYVPESEKCGGEVKLALGTLNALQNTKNMWNNPPYNHPGTFKIVKATGWSRGHRCWAESCICEWPLSNHLTGKAVDFSPENGTIADLQTMVDSNLTTLGWGGHEPFSETPTWVHAQIVPWGKD
jgi:hypothetical protein